MNIKSCFSTILVSFMIVFLSGCSGLVKDNTMSGGVGTLYEARGQADKEMPMIRFSIILHWEDRPTPNAINKIADSIKNITGIPQATVTALTSPERSLEKVFGGDRYEMNIPFEIDNPKNKNTKIVLDMGKKLQKAIDEAGLDGKVSIKGAKGKSGILLNGGMTIKVIQQDGDFIVNKNESE
jgi:hypothetical protein